jgi:hypothetical protein
VQLVCGSKATDAHIDAAGTLSYHDVVELGLDGQLEFSVDIARLAADCRRPSMSTTLSGVCADVRSIAGPALEEGVWRNETEYSHEPTLKSSNVIIRRELPRSLHRWFEVGFRPRKRGR